MAKPTFFKRLMLWFFISLSAIGALVALTIALVIPSLPSLESLTEYRPKLPLRVYSSDGFLMAEFGEERRAFIKIQQVPKKMKNAILAIEDRRFYQHKGVDAVGVGRAIVKNLAGASHEGASTITMQVARNFFLSSDKTLRRKISEVFLSYKIEKNLNKDQILELYINQIYLGQRAYGFGAAALVYYGKPLEKLTLAECALLAGLPKAPSNYNPFTNPKRAIQRQREVLKNMLRYEFIDQKAFEEAMNQTLHFKESRQSRDLMADHASEMVRQTLYDQYKEDIYTSGIKVYTTIKKANQEAANEAVLRGILDYDRRHEYRGPEKTIDLEGKKFEDQKTKITDMLDGIEEYNGFIPAVVIKAESKYVQAFTKKGDMVDIKNDGLALIQKTLSDKDPKNRRIKPGAIIRVIQKNKQWEVVQLPKVEASLVSMDPQTGAITALVGGFDFNRNKYNHVTQAKRQPGSTFKPFIYSAALEKGITPATIVNDAPLHFSAAETGSGMDWDPQNYDNDFDGHIRLRNGLAKSKNLVAIRVLKAIGAPYAQDYASRFGFDPSNHPAYLSMGLGVGSATLIEMVTAYGVFANGGYLKKPYLIEKMVDSQGQVIDQTNTMLQNEETPRVIDPRNAFIMTTLLQDVVNKGTAQKAKALGRSDIAGKTGTTNNQVDAWFAGYTPSQVAIAWIGFDQPKSLGKDETGSQAALPIWIKYMQTALKDMPIQNYEMPDGVMIRKIKSDTGTPANENEEGVNEYFYSEFPPHNEIHLLN
jgi:penicillin-binding protein 1A